MASRLPFYFVDVFATRPLTGNPLSLVPDADGLDEAQMRAIAREFNQSETTFLLRPSLPGATVRLRSYTPAGVEVGGVGHNALGAWLWLEAAGRLATEDARVVSTGAAHLLVPAGDRAAVDRAAPDTPRLESRLRHVGAEGCYLYSQDPVDAPVRSPTRGSSTRRSASRKTPRPEPLPGHWPPGSSPRARSPTSRRSSSSKVTRSDGPAGSPCRFPGSAFASAAPA
jgi:predicted PhzF superfamily epimerase YddE/YHI9